MAFSWDCLIALLPKLTQQPGGVPVEAGNLAVDLTCAEGAIVLLLEEAQKAESLLKAASRCKPQRRSLESPELYPSHRVADWVASELTKQHGLYMPRHGGSMI